MRRVLWGVAAVIATSTSLEAQAPDVKEWAVEWEGRPRDPAVDATGRVWFVGQTGNYIGRYDPTADAFRRYELEPNTLPHNLIAGSDGGIWYAGNGNGRIGRLDPVTGEIRTILMPDPRARDPHTLLEDGRGSIWFTVQNGGFIGRLDMASGRVELVSAGVERSRPYGIDFDSQGRAWVNLFGTNLIAVVDPATFSVRHIETPRSGARTRRIAVTSDDAVWYVDYAGGRLGRIDPESGAIREWVTPGGEESRPYALIADDRDRLWLSETSRAAPRLVGFDTKAEQFMPGTSVSAGIRHMVLHPETGTLWFGTDANNLGRAILP